MAEEDKKIVILLVIGVLLLLSYYFPKEEEEVPTSKPMIEEVVDTSAQTEFLEPIEEVSDEFEVIA